VSYYKPLGDRPSIPPPGCLWKSLAAFSVGDRYAEVWDIYKKSKIASMTLDSRVTSVALDDHKLLLADYRCIFVYDLTSLGECKAKIYCQNIEGGLLCCGGTKLAASNTVRISVMDFTPVVNKEAKMVLIPPAESENVYTPSEINCSYSSMLHMLTEKNNGGCMQTDTAVPVRLHSNNKNYQIMVVFMNAISTRGWKCPVYGYFVEDNLNYERHHSEENLINTGASQIPPSYYTELNSPANKIPSWGIVYKEILSPNNEEWILSDLTLLEYSSIYRELFNTEFMAVLGKL
jgi:hypothetical protein